MKLLPKMMISTKFRKILLTMRNKFDRMVAIKGSSSQIICDINRQYIPFSVSVIS